ncbi:MarR family winged helix-turn-helix transcriptional regulator [Marimonas lutisalis]|uniref:MarR family winged helix-turn-helix transcriptional regulator n=1 Tax=Marimonas lutisalis TaxID=2545756 RepID=UPI0010F5E1E9|nr:MarR family transcriptional regulator [Marimonas lutisalis]
MGQAQAKRPTPRAGDATLRGFVGYHVKRAMSVMLADLMRALEPYELRLVTYSALVVIVDNPGLRQAQLADILDIERPNLVQIVDDLEGKGLIRREKVPTDRRAYALMATDRGQEVAGEAGYAIRAAEEQRLVALSDEERREVIRAMNLIERGQGGAKA